MTTACSGPKKLKISWSALQAHEFCKQKAMLMRERKKSPASNIRPFFHGIVCDRVMRRWLESDNPRPGEMLSWVEEMVESCLVEARDSGDGVVRWKSREDRAEMTAWSRRLVTRLEPMLDRWVLPFDYQPEYRFRVPLRIPYIDGGPAEVLLNGGMDILVREEEGPPAVWAGYDLKATENPDYLRKTLGQGIFYDLAVRAGVGKGTSPRTFAFLQPMVESNPVAHVVITDDDRRSMLARIVSMAHSIWRDDVAPKPGPEGCGFCQVRHGCAKFSGTSEGAVWAPKPGRRAAARSA
jgi:hypothetical protein